MYIQMNTTNQSFIDQVERLKDSGINNYNFPLNLIDDRLLDIDPWSDELTKDEENLIIRECRNNIWYFIREVVRLQYILNTHEYAKVCLTEVLMAMVYSAEHNIALYYNRPRQSGGTLANALIYMWCKLADIQVKTIGDNNLRMRLEDIKLPRYFKDIKDVYFKNIKDVIEVHERTNRWKIDLFRGYGMGTRLLVDDFEYSKIDPFALLAINITPIISSTVNRNLLHQEPYLHTRINQFINTREIFTDDVFDKGSTDNVMYYKVTSGVDFMSPQHIYHFQSMMDPDHFAGEVLCERLEPSLVNFIVVDVAVNNVKGLRMIELPTNSSLVKDDLYKAIDNEINNLLLERGLDETDITRNATFTVVINSEQQGPFLKELIDTISESIEYIHRKNDVISDIRMDFDYAKGYIHTDRATEVEFRVIIK